MHQCFCFLLSSLFFCVSVLRSKIIINLIVTWWIKQQMKTNKYCENSETANCAISMKYVLTFSLIQRLMNMNLFRPNDIEMKIYIYVQINRVLCCPIAKCILTSKAHQKNNSPKCVCMGYYLSNIRTQLYSTSGFFHARAPIHSNTHTWHTHWIYSIDGIQIYRQRIAEHNRSHCVSYRLVSPGHELNSYTRIQTLPNIHIVS